MLFGCGLGGNGGLDPSHKGLEVGHHAGNGRFFGQRTENLSVFAGDGADKGRRRVADGTAFRCVNSRYHPLQCVVGDGEVQVVEGAVRAFLRRLCRRDTDDVHIADFMKE